MKALVDTEEPHEPLAKAARKFRFWPRRKARADTAKPQVKEAKAEGRPETPLVMPASPTDGWMDHLAAVHNVEFNQLSVAISVSASATPIILGYLYGLPSSCEALAAVGHTINPETKEPLACISDVAYLALPLAPLSILLFYCYLFLNARLVGKYSRALERAIVSGDPRTDNHETLTFPALSRLNGALYGGESRRLIPFRTMFVFFATTLFVIEVFTIFHLAQRIFDETLRSWAYWGYGAMLLICTLSFVVGASHSGWDDLRFEALRREKLLDTTPIREYPWGSYLWHAVLPRFASLLKAIDVLPLALVLIWVSAEESPRILHALGWIFVYEIVLYQTRYFMNGAREIADPQFGLPADIRNNTNLPWTPLQRLMTPPIIAARLVLFVWIFTTFSDLSRREALIVVVCFVGVFYAYELPREIARRKQRSALRLAREAAAKRPANFLTEIRDRTHNALSGKWGRHLADILFVTVGAGYALRVAVFIYLVSPDLLRTPLGLASVVLYWAIGSAQVAMGWAVEFQGAKAKDPKASAYSFGVLTKPHLYWAARHIDSPAVEG